jgi:hypothetical protein
LFIDFNNGDILQLSGRTEIILDGPKSAPCKVLSDSGGCTWSKSCAALRRWRCVGRYPN